MAPSSKTATPPSSTPEAPALNSTAIEILTVSRADLASALKPHDGTGTYPDVLATPVMIGLMEMAAGKLLVPCLPSKGHLSVGVDVDITHSAGTPPGETVTATARYTGRRKRLYEFEVVVEDRGGVVGRGVHRRAIVEVERVRKGTEERLKKGKSKL